MLTISYYLRHSCKSEDHPKGLDFLLGTIVLDTIIAIAVFIIGALLATQVIHNTYPGAAYAVLGTGIVLTFITTSMWMACISGCRQTL